LTVTSSKEFTYILKKQAFHFMNMDFCSLATSKQRESLYSFRLCYTGKIDCRSRAQHLFCSSWQLTTQIGLITIQSIQ